MFSYTVQFAGRVAVIRLTHTQTVQEDKLANSKDISMLLSQWKERNPSCQIGISVTPEFRSSRLVDQRPLCTAVRTNTG